MAFRVLFSVVVLASCLTMNVFGGVDDIDNVSWTQAPHHAPSYPPVGAPAPHHHHHKGVGGHHHKRASPPMVHPPSKAPVQPPSRSPAPVQPPSHLPAPVRPPSHSPAPVHAPLPSRRMVAVGGVVYCKPCKYKGVDTLLGATPLQGAVVLLTCNNTKYPLRVKGTTDVHGFFFIMPPKTVTTYGTHKCRVTLLSSPSLTCNQPTNLHNGVKGAILVPSKTPRVSIPAAPALPYGVFTVGPFAYEPSPKTPCPHESVKG